MAIIGSTFNASQDARGWNSTADNMQRGGSGGIAGDLREGIRWQPRLGMHCKGGGGTREWVRALEAALQGPAHAKESLGDGEEPRARSRVRLQQWVQGYACTGGGLVGLQQPAGLVSRGGAVVWRIRSISAERLGISRGSSAAKALRMVPCWSAGRPKSRLRTLKSSW